MHFYAMNRHEMIYINMPMIKIYDKIDFTRLEVCIISMIEIILIISAIAYYIGPKMKRFSL